MGEVFLARVVGVAGFAKQVAIKRIYPDRSGDYEARKLFVREAKLVAQLDHPNIVQVLELGADGDDLYMAMEFVQGADLSYLVKQLRQNGQKLSTEQVLVITQDVIAALEHAHAFVDEARTMSGIIHADVSPTNVIVTQQGFAKLCDFGVAKILRRQRVETTMRGRWGKLAYMAPEQLRDNVIDKRIDVYALGAVLYELFAGKRMINESSMDAMIEALVAGDVPRLGTLRPDLSRLLCEVIHKACAVDPDERWASVTEMREALADSVPAFDVAKARGEVADLVRQNRPPFETPTPIANSDHSDGITDSFAGESPTRIIQLKPPVTEPPIVPIKRTRPIAVISALGLVATIAVVAAIASGTAKKEKKPVIVQQTAQPQMTLAQADEPRLATPRTGEAAVATDITEARPTPPQDRSRPPKQTHTPAAPAKPKPLIRESVQPAVQSKEPARLTINAIPWANVSIDGVVIKDTPILNHTLPPGPHKVVLRGPNGKHVELTLNLKPGENVKKIVELK